MITSAPLAMLQQFDRHARNWRLLDSPLRPCAADLRLMQHNFNDWHATYPAASSSSPLRALLLGVTPEIATHEWGEPVELTAVDISQAMIDAVWPGDTAMRHAHCADWMTMPIAQHGFDILLADGVFTLLSYPAGYSALVQVIRRCLKQDGLFMLRAFCRPDTAETLPNILDDLWNKRIGNFHAFKWRLAMAIQGNEIFKGVSVAEIWRTFHAHVPDMECLAQTTGWPVEVIATIDAYRDSAAVYSFPIRDELIEAVAPYLNYTGHETGDYELAERCPLLCFTPCRK